MKILQANETKVLTVDDEINTADDIEFDDEQINIISDKKDVKHYLTRTEAARWTHLNKHTKTRMLRQAMQAEQRKTALRTVGSKEPLSSGKVLGGRVDLAVQEPFTLAERKEQKRRQYLQKRKKTEVQNKSSAYGAVDPSTQGTSSSVSQSSATSAGNLPAGGNTPHLDHVSNTIQASNAAAHVASGAAETAQTAAATAASGGGDLAVKVAKKTAEKFRQELEGAAGRDEKKAEEVKADILAHGGDQQSVTALTRGLGEKIVTIAATVVGAVAGMIANAASMVLTPFAGIIAAIVIIFCILFSALSPPAVGGYQGVAHVPQSVEFYRPYLEKYAALYPGMENLVDLMLAMIMQEAGGEPWIGTMDGDIMQSSESAGYPGPGYLTGEASIAQGVKYLATEVFNRAGLLEDPYNLDKTKLALQGYNYGAGYIPWALNNYGGYTEANAAIFSDMMAARLGWSNYGDKLYVPHVLRYYEIKWVGFGISVSTSEISNAETKQKLAELSSRWPLDLEEGRKNIILKGCTLVGYTTYDMYGEDTRAGVDLPRTLDCSSFVAWCFQKCGYTDVPYGSTTGTFLSASNFRRIDGSQLKPGDIGLINWVGSGGSNHVGIYVGTDASGTPMWLHCTSHPNPGSSIVTGPRISYYSAFTLFFRYTGFH